MYVCICVQIATDVQLVTNLDSSASLHMTPLLMEVSTVASHSAYTPCCITATHHTLFGNFSPNLHPCAQRFCRPCLPALYGGQCAETATPYFPLTICSLRCNATSQLHPQITSVHATVLTHHLHCMLHRMKVWIGLQTMKMRLPTRAGLKLLVGVCALQVDGIREYWSFCGEIEDLDVMRFPDTGRFKGIAFITYATVSSHTSALTLGWRLHSALHPDAGFASCTAALVVGQAICPSLLVSTTPVCKSFMCTCCKRWENLRQVFEEWRLACLVKCCASRQDIALLVR